MQALWQRMGLLGALRWLPWQRDGNGDGLVEFASAWLQRHDGRQGHAVPHKPLDNLRWDDLGLRVVKNGVKNMLKGFRKHGKMN